MNGFQALVDVFNLLPKGGDAGYGRRGTSGIHPMRDRSE
jgi:hypothetical protein